MRKKYVVCPGWIFKDNNEKNYVSADSLIKLYKVARSQCIIVMHPDYVDSAIAGYTKADLIFLYPRNDGNYNLK
jgi:hypothetical protein